MNELNNKVVIASVILIAFIVATIFWTMVIVDGEDMFVIGAVISSAFFVICLDFLLAREFYDIAEQKGYSDVKYFWYSVLFGLFGFLMVIALPDKSSQKN